MYRCLDKNNTGLIDFQKWKSEFSDDSNKITNNY